MIADQIEATRVRKQRRNALREAFTLHKLTQVLNNRIIASAARQEYTTAVPVYDIREYHPSGPVGICVIGGFIGELLMTINALNDSILANPNLNDFRLNCEQIERFIEDWMRAGDFPEGTCVVKITEKSHA